MKYIAKDRLNIIISRSFNHIGPKQSIGFVTSDFAKQIAYIILHKEEPVIKVGNLSAERDFTDVRDVVRAYVKLIEKCKIPDIYNICSGKAIRIMDVLNIMLDNVKEEIKIVIDEDKYRPIDVQTSYGSYKKLYNKTKWVPKISINQSIKDILKYWLSINSE